MTPQNKESDGKLFYLTEVYYYCYINRKQINKIK